MRRMKLEVCFNGGKVSNCISNATHFVVMSLPGFNVDIDAIVKRESCYDHCVEVVVDEFQKFGLIVDRAPGLNDEFLKGWINSLNGMRLMLLSNNLMVRYSVGRRYMGAWGTSFVEVGKRIVKEVFPIHGCSRDSCAIG
ncbi:hypothetical protein L1987_40055 [Smallanthus sonchifolius]|uniref:Uncharacterized protein n=1 Tax=Smallanthus sonchifolius TaxID=185202 RepID=A0ACB9GSD2_9ASTR|nr:hypothetical protein L1987_40055 [Smallanthus sonchifolius]